MKAYGFKKSGVDGASGPKVSGQPPQPGPKKKGPGSVGPTPSQPGKMSSSYRKKMEFEDTDQDNEMDEYPETEPMEEAETPLSRKNPTMKLSEKSPIISAGQPEDRLKGYRKYGDRAFFTGSDAHAALVGAFKKKGMTKNFKVAKTKSAGGY